MTGIKLNKLPSPRQTRVLARWLLMSALLIKALVPDGFMPSAGQWVELCTAHGIVMVEIEPHWDSPDGMDDSEHPPSPEPCPWSACFHALQTANFWPDSVLPPPSTALPIIGRSSNHQRLAVALPPLRGPPSYLS